MIFKKEKIYKTNLNCQQIIKELNAVTEKYYSGSSDKLKFEGKINLDSFTILPTFNYSPNAQLRPEIIGQLKEKKDGTEIHLKFHLPKVLFLLLIFILNLGVLFLMISMPQLIDFPLWNKWWLLLIFLAFTFLIFNHYFSFKVNKSEKVLIYLFKMKQIA